MRAVAEQYANKPRGWRVMASDKDDGPLNVEIAKGLTETGANGIAARMVAGKTTIAKEKKAIARVDERNRAAAKARDEEARKAGRSAPDRQPARATAPARVSKAPTPRAPSNAQRTPRTQANPPSGSGGASAA